MCQQLDRGVPGLMAKGRPDSYHDWDAHLQSIDELALEFDLQDEIPEDLP